VTKAKKKAKRGRTRSALIDHGFRVAIEGVAMSGGAALIAIERRRQLDSEDNGGEGWTAEHDDEHGEGNLARAACCYAWSSLSGRDHDEGPAWPWDEEWDKRPAHGASLDERIRALEKAGALVAAEVDRLWRQRRAQAMAGKRAGADASGGTT
jgi:hypothetical protein